MKLLVISSTLSSTDSFKSFKVDDICNLVESYYPKDFSHLDKARLRIQLQHFEFQDISTISKLCRILLFVNKNSSYKSSRVFMITKY